MKGTEKFCTTKEFRQKYLPISDINLRRMINEEGAPILRIGRKFLIPVDKFLEWVENKIK
jgi:excisionase family DNA binding protein